MLDSLEAKGAILVHMNTGKVLYEKNMHQKLAPASLTKMMTMLMLIERINRGEIKLTDMVVVSPTASKIGGCRVEFDPGEHVRVDDLLKTLALPSSNDGAVIVSELLSGGTHQDFVDMMNAKAQQLGMTNSQFDSAHGMSWVRKHFTSPYDIMLLSKALIETRLIFNYCSLKQSSFIRENGSVQMLETTNPLLGVYPGVDGLKTGKLIGRGFNLSATLQRGEHRFIAVVMETQTRAASAEEGKKLLDYALSLPEYQE